jgi:hypothetical protein
MRDAARGEVMFLVDVPVKDSDIVARGQDIDGALAVTGRPLPLRKEWEERPVRQDHQRHVCGHTREIGLQPRDLRVADGAAGPDA